MPEAEEVFEKCVKKLEMGLTIQLKNNNFADIFCLEISN